MSDISGRGIDKDQLVLINKLYELGFEVGYKNHSEVGWVLREYNKLVNEAANLGIQAPENYYNEGKIKGRTSRDKGIGESSGKMAQDTGASRTSEAETNPDREDEGEADGYLKKPLFEDFPRMVKKISMIEVPKLLYGFKHTQRK